MLTAGMTLILDTATRQMMKKLSARGEKIEQKSSLSQRLLFIVKKFA